MKSFFISLMIAQAVSLSAQSFSVGSFNVNYANTSKLSIQKTIEESQVDVLALQETVMLHENHIRKAFSGKYRFKKFTEGKKKYLAEGFGFISKYPISSSKFIKPKYGMFGAFVAVIKIDKKQIQFVNIHLDPPKFSKTNNILQCLNAIVQADNIHLEELKYILENIDKNIATIILGDFNSLPNSKTCNFMKEKGFIDCVEKTSENPALENTWFMRCKQREIFSRIDYVFCDSSFLPENTITLKKTGSDHFLLKVEFNTKLQ